MKRLFAIALCSIALLGCKKEDCQSGVDSIVYEYDGVKVTIVCGCVLYAETPNGYYTDPSIGPQISDPIYKYYAWKGYSKMKSVAKKLIQDNKDYLIQTQDPDNTKYQRIKSECSQ